MPCYQVNLTTVEFKATNYDLLEKAVHAMGGVIKKYGQSAEIRIPGKPTLSFDMRRETMTAVNSNNVNSTINELKRGYSREVIQAAAKKNRWTLQKKSSNKFIALKY